MKTSAVVNLLIALFIAVPATAQEQGKSITVFTAKKIVTMDPTQPTATAIAVRDGMILGVGSLQDLAPWLKGSMYTINDQFKENVILPGFIDPHMHPMLGAIAFQTVWITPEPWNVMGHKTPATIGEKAYRATLKKAFDSRDPNAPIFMTWGFSSDTHGELSGRLLDDISKDVPILVLQRSLHEAYINTPLLTLLKTKGLNPNKFKDHLQIDWSKNHFWEDGLFSVVLPFMSSFLLDPNAADPGYLKTRDYLTYNGVTTVADMNTGGTNWELEISALKRNLDTPESPIRVRLTPDVMKLAAALKSPEAAMTLVNQMKQHNTDNLVFNGGIKLFADGAMFSQAMQINAPGYIDGHKGEWITQPSSFVEFARSYWNAGYQIHVHTNGDGGAKMVLDTLQELENDKPRADHRFTVEHYGYADDGTSRRIAKLDAQVSANPFYLFDLGDRYAENGLGFDRAARIAPLGGLASRNVPVALHSDFPMAPAEPLFLAWTAMSRETLSGKVFSPSERLTLDQAIRAITIDAAYMIGMENEVGSIEAGKLADFAVLDKDPYEVGMKGLRDIKVWGTVFRGKVHQAKK
ncbi:amidohydrolase [Shewanella oneidensis]|uniref:Periplasmic amidohydrolase family protein n=1 Tax=Shewanella oneidensis (strain ATCC 700550 / JCM 31522 / CIP 106686 / LMG 19005 / NCIMB 14063 / MR-1) TaxID=211586 RepID=Q8E841_SHEON|nr:amidohydrolase [Shewanella oneidensis]AAN53027.1 periplasmic amidohydrolase family protein [Shewanella oneidensis MR-1]MDX5999728.1 amidohydrolase [Shewanella oneidensis]MEE2030344.1 N-substituted formamide deformylase [Shewanella oneidensis]